MRPVLSYSSIWEMKGVKKKNILITGLPGVGKTTLIRRVVEALKDLGPIGFYTREIREGGIRKGFEWVSLDGRRGILSHVGLKGPYRVGKYRVDVEGFEGFLQSFFLLSASAGLIVIDEIGKMECFSEKFREGVRRLLDSDSVVMATLALRGSGFIAEVKQRKDVEIYQVTQGNRDSLWSEILEECRRNVLR